ncbi:MAG: hypothetical protein K8T90_16600 [Planctomycetes bacterium]|nr:hypothetical protein [Planctomycetota bacterium]
MSTLATATFRVSARVAACIALGVVAVASAFATVVLRADVAEMTDLCTRAVSGTVEAEWVEHDVAKGQIWTNWRLRVDETWLGATEATVVVSVPGGASGGVTQEFEGGAHLTKGDRAAVFLWKRDDGRLLVLGEAQGAFHIRRDVATGADVCENAIDGLVLMDRAGKRVDAAPLRMTLDDLRSRVGEARRLREERERAEHAAYELRMAALRTSAERHAEMARGRPGGPPAK